MLKLYEKYLEVVDRYIKKCFDDQQPFIHCNIGCCDCCTTGEYPFSRLEMEYLMAGFPELPPKTQKRIKHNIKTLLEEKNACDGRFLHKCPFLLDGNCAMYERRGITCRVFGLAYFETVNGKRIVKLPECSKCGLNYSEVLNNDEIGIEEFHKRGVDGPVSHPLNLTFFEKEILNGVNGLEFGEIRPILDWFVNIRQNQMRELDNN